ncbi:MAG: entericidin A/B family lipoprotein [Planctomycetota bacterium]|jgi:predicted small secreted protein
MKKSMMIAALALFALALLALPACNTVEGVGRDVSAAGDGLANLADDTKSDKSK